MLGNVMYILPMILGRTFDVRYDRVGIDIFPQSELARAKEFHEPQSTSRYEMTDTSEEVRNLLEVSGDLALKVKAGTIDLKGTGTYLKDTSRVGRTVEILTRLNFVTYTIALPLDVKPFQLWNMKRREDLGTHYVRSITYGGELLASITFRAKKEEDLKVIKGAVKGTFSGGDAGSLIAEGKLENLQYSLQDKASMEISYYATVPLKGVPNTIDGLRNLVKDFDIHVQEVNNGWGVPIRVELVELSSLGPEGSSFTFLKNSALEAEMGFMELEFDDLRNSQARLTEWLRSLPASITSEQEKEIADLYTRINKVMRPYYDAIGNMDIEKGVEQFQSARDAYTEGRLSSLPGKFGKALDKLMKKIVVVEKRLFGTGTGTYVRWGTTECSKSSPMTTQLDSGYTAISLETGIGGGSEYLCLPDKPQEEDTSPPFGDTSSSYLAGVRYGLMEESPFIGDDVRLFFGHGVPCSTCHMTNRTLVTTFPAMDKCPSGWITEYSGYLMSGKTSGHRGQYICVNEEPKDYSKLEEERSTHSLSLVYIQPGGLPESMYKAEHAISCAVCSK